MSNIDISITPYLNYIANFKVLTREEEKTVAQKVKEGDEEARKKLILSNLRFVVSVAKKYVNSGIPLIDLISEGNIGLLKAVDKFDPSKDIQFITYAIFWIKQSIIQAIAEKSKMIKLPLSWNNNLAYLSKNNINENIIYEKEKFKKLSEELKMNQENFKHLLQLSKKSYSLEDRIYQQDSEGTQIMNKIQDKNIVNPEQALLNNSIDKDINEILSALSSIEKRVIIQRFGLFNQGAPQTLSEIGKKEGLTKERIRQIEKIALKTIKEKVEKNKYLNYLVA